MSENIMTNTTMEITITTPKSLTLGITSSTTGERREIAFIPDDTEFIRKFTKVINTIGLTDREYAKAFKDIDNIDNIDAEMAVEKFEKMETALQEAINKTQFVYDATDEMFGAGISAFITGGVFNYAYLIPLFDAVGQMFESYAKERNEKFAPYMVKRDE